MAVATVISFPLTSTSLATTNLFCEPTPLCHTCIHEVLSQSESFEHLLRAAVMDWEHDAATGAAIVATQLEDLEELNRSKDNDADGSSNDATVARQIYQGDLERHVATLCDRQIATLFGESPLENEDLPLSMLPTIPDPHMLNWTEGPQEEPETSSGCHNVEQQAERRSDSPILGLLARKRKASDSPPPTCKAPRLSDHTVDDPVCTACMSPILPSELIQLPCDHNYCMECTMRLFTTAMTDETLFPPQCCDISIPLARVRSEVDAEFEEAFKKRQVELSTPASERTYCASQTCSLFLGSRTEGLQEDRVHCPKCNTDTCTTCKGVAHESSYCPQDPSIISLMATAASYGYKQCPSCHLVIELTFGCHHMTYVCVFPLPLLPMLTQYPADVAAKINSALIVSQPGKNAPVIFGTRTALSSVRRSSSIETKFKLLCQAKLITTKSNKLPEISGQIMRVHIITFGGN